MPWALPLAATAILIGGRIGWRKDGIRLLLLRAARLLAALTLTTLTLAPSRLVWGDAPAALTGEATRMRTDVSLITLIR